jgi:hypothetical protein
MLEFLVLILFFLFSGLPLSFYFSKVLHFRSIFALGFFSIILGIIFFNLFVLSLGHLGFSLYLKDLLIYGLIYAFVLYFLLFPFVKTSYSEIFQNLKQKVDWADIFIGVILMLIFGLFILIVNTRFFPSWDHFTYWIIDPRIIFETGYLRSNTEVVNLFSYSSYQSLHALYIYHVFEEIREQFTSWFTILYAFLGSILSLFLFKNSPSYHKILGLSGIIFVLGSFLAQSLIFNFYADVLVAFHVVFIFFLCFQKIETFSGYTDRGFLILVNLLVIALVKSFNIYYSFVIASLIFIYDYFNHRNFWEIRLFLSKRALAYLFFLITALACRDYYTSKVFIDSVFSLNPVKDDLSLLNAEKHLIHSDKIFDFLLSHYTALISFIVFIMLLVRRWTTAKVLIVLGLFSLPLMNIIHYILILKSLDSQSLLRYVSTIFFCIPALIPVLVSRKVNDSKFFKAKFFAAILLVIFSILWLFSFFLVKNLDKDFTFHNGKYSEFRWQKGQHDKALYIKNIIGADRVMLLSGDYKNIVGNMSKSSIEMRYYLLPNAIGGLSGFRKPDHILDHIKTINPEYILLKDYKDNALMKKAFPYLLDKEKEPINNSGRYLLIRYDESADKDFSIVSEI